MSSKVAIKRNYLNSDNSLPKREISTGISAVNIVRQSSLNPSNSNSHLPKRQTHSLIKRKEISLLDPLEYAL